MDLSHIKSYQKMLSQLPKGNLSYKTINGKKYPYLQWREDGKTKSRIVKPEELSDLKANIEQRKALEKKLREANVERYSLEAMREDFFFTEVKTAEDLKSFTEPVKKWKKRECYSKLHDYIYGNSPDRVLVLYGLCSTGKKTLMRQLISEMSEESLSKTAFMQARSSITFPQISLDLKRLLKEGKKYIFIDEATLMNDFIDSASSFSDIYASCGMKIVLSGTDSLGFLFSEERELYDRCFVLHTTFVPYREFESVLGIKGIDKYIEHGGTMSLGGIDYNNKGMPFASEKSTGEYIDSAIAGNIQHSLKNYPNDNHLRKLFELYNSNELKSAINRVVEDINHSFVLEVLTEDLRSIDLPISANDLPPEREASGGISDRIDAEELTDRLKELLEIKNKASKTAFSESYRAEAEEYLRLLDLLVELDVVYMSDLDKREKHTALTQPGMRYSQAEALIKSLLKDSIFASLSLEVRNSASRRIMSCIKGRMLEDIVVLETKLSKPECEVFRLVFISGEFDMVVFCPESASCKIYEIKYSDKRTNEQYRHLIDEEKCRQTEFRFGRITERTVLYLGESFDDSSGVSYRNIEEYLGAL